MFKRAISIFVTLSVLILITTIVSADHSPPPQRGGFTVEPALEWDAVFDRMDGWTGADGIFSFPSNEDESSSPANSADTYWVFSDTFIGAVTETDQRQNSRLVNNTMASLIGNDANPDDATFYWAGAASNPTALFKPSTPLSAEGNWYWLQDGVMLGDSLFVYPLRMKEGNGGSFNFATAGVGLIEIDLTDTSPFANATQADAPLYLPASGNRGEINFGIGVMPNTVNAGAPNPDGYLYIYGVQNDPFNKKLVAARVLAEDIANFNMYRFWDGAAWVPNIANAAPITDRVSSELSVHPLADGTYMLTFQRDTLSPVTSVRFGSSPVGPFGNLIDIYTCPEAATDIDVFCYNAKAHPHLSDDPNKVLISYNVNTLDFLDHFSNADIYRPRFIWLTLDSVPTAVNFSSAGVTPSPQPLIFLFGVILIGVVSLVIVWKNRPKTESPRL